MIRNIQNIADISKEEINTQNHQICLLCQGLRIAKDSSTKSKRPSKPTVVFEPDWKGGAGKAARKAAGKAAGKVAGNTLAIAAAAADAVLKQSAKKQRLGSFPGGDADAPRPAPSKPCPKGCGFVNRNFASECGGCGTAFPKQHCLACGTSTKMGPRRCKNCKTPFAAPAPAAQAEAEEAEAEEAEADVDSDDEAADSEVQSILVGANASDPVLEIEDEGEGDEGAEETVDALAASEPTRTKEPVLDVDTKRTFENSTDCFLRSLWPGHSDTLYDMLKELVVQIDLQVCISPFKCAVMKSADASPALRLFQDDTVCCIQNQNGTFSCVYRMHEANQKRMRYFDDLLFLHTPLGNWWYKMLPTTKLLMDHFETNVYIEIDGHECNDRYAKRTIWSNLEELSTEATILARTVVCPKSPLRIEKVEFLYDGKEVLSLSDTRSLLSPVDLFFCADEERRGDANTPVGIHAVFSFVTG